MTQPELLTSQMALEKIAKGSARSDGELCNYCDAELPTEKYPDETGHSEECPTAVARAALLDQGDRCHAGRDGDCVWANCPQLRDGEPIATGRHYPLDKGDDNV